MLVNYYTITYVGILSMKPPTSYSQQFLLQIRYAYSLLPLRISTIVFNH